MMQEDVLNARLNQAMHAYREADRVTVELSMQLLCVRARLEHPDAVAVVLGWSDQGPFMDTEAVELPDGSTADWYEEDCLASNITESWAMSLPMIEDPGTPYQRVETANRRLLIEEHLGAEVRPSDLEPVPPELLVMEWDQRAEPFTGSSGGVALHLDPGEIYTVCPICGEVNAEVYEIDVCERWNPTERSTQPDEIPVYSATRDSRGMAQTGTELNPLAGLPLLVVLEESSDFSTDGHACGSCRERVTLPDWIESTWS